MNTISQPDPVRLEIFKNLYQFIAEQMGIVLQNTAASVNIKERLDFSCAIFDAGGDLVSQAAHIPVHLGAMPMTLSAVLAEMNLQPGDMVITNTIKHIKTYLKDKIMQTKNIQI